MNKIKTVLKTVWNFVVSFATVIVMIISGYIMNMQYTLYNAAQPYKVWFVGFGGDVVKSETAILTGLIATGVLFICGYELVNRMISPKLITIKAKDSKAKASKSEKKEEAKDPVEVV